jgi:hypothetical protein
MEIEDRGLNRRHGRGESRDPGATDPSECGTSEARAAQARRDDWSEGLGAHESISLHWMGGPGSCGEQEARAAGQVEHPHDYVEWAEDKLERVQDSQQAWRLKITHEAAAMRLGPECKAERCMNLIDEKGEVSIFG